VFHCAIVPTFSGLLVELLRGHISQGILCPHDGGDGC
jgi:hypothetical protein